jgi:predicted amidophosphoribosyltransferase
MAAIAGRVIADLLGEGLPAPGVALERHGFQPDEPGTWCLRCGSRACVPREGGTRKALPDAARPPAGVNARAPCLQGVRGRRVVRLGTHEGALREWIVAIKHAPWPAMAEELGHALGRQVLRCAPDLGGRRDGVIVVPVPSPLVRRLDRGVDHAAAIAAGVARELDVGLVQPLRQRALGTQVARAHAARRRAPAERAARFARARGPWAWMARRSVRGRIAIVVDDVRTTGSTLGAVGALLRGMGAAAVIEAVLSVREWSVEGRQPAAADGSVDMLSITHGGARRIPAEASSGPPKRE